jgi:hypothetical protein
MKSILIFVLTLTALQGYSQVAATWKGNTPGHELEWDTLPTGAITVYLMNLPDVVSRMMKR